MEEVIDMVWSKFVHLFPDAGIIWHAVRMETIRMTPEIIREFSRSEPSLLPPEQFGLLVARGFIIPEQDSKEECAELIASVIKEHRNIQAMYLILTTTCNLRCSYCLYNASRSGSLSGKGSLMNPEVALKAIELFSEETAKNDRSVPGYWEDVTFYGGEPLLNFSCMELSIRRIRELQRTGQMWDGVHFILNTNGVLLSDRILDFLKTEEVEIQISIDGPQDVHDKVRVFRSGKGSFKSVVAKLDRMKAQGIDFVPLITISEANINLLPGCIEWLCRRFSIKRYGLNLMMHTQGDVDPEYGEKAARAMRETHAIAKFFGAVDRAYEDASEVFASGRFVPQSCGAGRKLVVFPHGGIHACQALEASGITAIGQLPVFDPDSPNRIHWSQRNRFNNQTCLACPAVGGCGGGCGASAFNSIGDIHGVDPNHCSWMKNVFSQWLKRPHR